MHKPNLSTMAFLAFLTAIVVFPCMVQAQARINMPNSLYGVGEVRFNQNVNNMGMAGVAQAYRTNRSINDINPASYSALDSTSFVFETSLFSHLYGQRTSSATQRTEFIALGNISLGFPLTPWWSFAAGVKPYSQVGYFIRAQDPDAPVEDTQYIYEGHGGIDQVFIGTGARVFKGLSLGVNASYLFGSINHEISASSQSDGGYRTNVIGNHRTTGWIMGLGMQYRHEVSPTRYFTVGATYGGQGNINLTHTETLRRMLPDVLGYDTLSFQEMDEKTLALPAHFGFGVFGRINEYWEGGLDFQWQNWGDFQMPGRPGTLNDAWQVAAGIRHLPSRDSYATLFQRINYSAGMRYGQSYFRPLETDLNEFGISFGLDIPVRRSFTGFRMAFEYSTRGSESDHPMQEHFFRVNFGVNIYERWFERRRFL